MNNAITTPVLVLLLVATAVASLMTLYGQGTAKKSMGTTANPASSGQGDNNSDANFPVADFDTHEPYDPNVRTERVRKSSRHDKKRFVSKDPTPRVSESARIIEGHYVPAIPAEQSSVVIVGEVLDATAHLSNDKSGIYSEFTVRIHEVLKFNGPAPLAQGDRITFEREGGVVRYPNGHKRLYRIMDQGMPRVDGSYVLFLSTVEEGQTYNLLTGYELLSEAVIPIDYSKQFTAYKGYDTAAFLEEVRASISKGQ